MRLITLALIGAITIGCSDQLPSAQQLRNDAAQIEARNKEQRAEALAVIQSRTECSSEDFLLNVQTFERCFFEGMSYENVNNITGQPGKKVHSSEHTQIYQWNTDSSNNDETIGIMTATFEDGVLVGYSQSGLPDPLD